MGPIPHPCPKRRFEMTSHLPRTNFLNDFVSTGASLSDQPACTICMPRTYKKRSLADRFWTKVDKQPTCWEWQSARDKNGYGVFIVQGKTKLAHRVAYELTYGLIPAGMVIMHLCNNCRCVRPDHLRAGTQKENIQQAWVQGRCEATCTAARQRRLTDYREAQSKYAQESAILRAQAENWRQIHWGKK
jgi:hypothetical protein